MTKKYKISEEECKRSISGVCSRCGKDLEPIETVDNGNNPTFWPGCNDCGYFDHGAKKDVYKISKSLVDDGVLHYQKAPHDPALSEYYKKEEIHRACGIVSAVLSRQKLLKGDT